MFRKDSPITPDKKDLNCVLMNGGVGDHVGGSLIAIDYILKRYTWLNLMIWVPDFLLDFARNVLPPNANVRHYSSMKKHYDPNISTINTAWDGRISPMKIHHTDYAFQVLCDEKVDVTKKNYLKINSNGINIKKFGLPEKYVVFCTGYTAAVREFHPDAINYLTGYVKSKGYAPVFLGQKQTQTGSTFVIQGIFKDGIDFSSGIDLIDQTTLLQAAKIMGDAKAVVGVDCGLMHVAGCTDVAIVGGYTTVSPELRMPVRNDVLGFNCYPVVPDEDLGCRFCQVNTNFLYGRDYKDCMYGDFLCVSQLTGEKFKAQLEKIL